jgi:hypothetical protein
MKRSIIKTFFIYTHNCYFFGNGVDNTKNKYYNGIDSKGGVTMEKPILVYQKRTDKTTNKLIIPKAIIEQWGNEFYMEIYQDKIILKPIKGGE